MIYFIYEHSLVNERKGFIEEIGQYAGFLIGRTEEFIVYRDTLPECMVIPEKVALAYKFAGRRKGYFNVRPDTNQYDQTDKDKLEQVGEKLRYTLTEEDKYNAHLFEKAIMHCMLNKYYNNKLYMFLGTPDIFKAEMGYLSLEDLYARKKGMQERIDECKDMEETSDLMHYNFGIQKYPEKEAKIDL